MYQQINLSDHSIVGEPGTVPSIFGGWIDAALADISAAVAPAPQGWADQGLWPVTGVTTPTFDPTQQTLNGTVTYTVNTSSRTVTGIADLRSATPAEVAAAQASLREAQSTILLAACAAQIMGGYQSLALGSTHTYPAKPTDQANMTASVVASLMPGLSTSWTTPFWCADSTGAWSYQAHTSAQIQQAGQDGKAAILTAQTKLATLNAQLASATTQAQIEAVVW